MRSVIIVYLIVFSYALSFAQSLLTEKQLAEFESYIVSEIAMENLVGISVAYKYKNQEWSKGYGYADLENKVPATAASRYRLASVTKPMTAVGILKLFEMGKINLDDVVQKYVPYFPRKKWPVTIRHLLGHLSGISHYKNYNKEAGTTEQMDTRQALDIFDDWDLLFEPGTKYQYTTYGYNLLGAVIEGASGESYENFMTQNVWQPLAMDGISIDYMTQLIPSRVRGYQRIAGKIVNSRPVNTSLKIPGGGTRATALDMVRFADGINKGKVLSKDMVKIMWTPMIFKNKRESDYGMGWAKLNFNGHYVIGHSGGQEGTRTLMIHFPAIDLTVSGASNFENGGPANAVYYLAALLLDEDRIALPYYVEDKKDDALLTAVKRIFYQGLRHYEFNKQALTNDKNQIENAFKYFDDILQTDIKQFQKIDDMLDLGEHPVSGFPFKLMGSYMAAEIDKQNHGALQKAFKKGPLFFFEQYIKIQKNQPPALQIPADFADKVNYWSKEWALTNNALVKDFDFAAMDIVTFLNDQFSGKRIYPDFAGRISQVTQDLFLAGNIDLAMDISKTAIKVYPSSATSNAYHGMFLYMTGSQNGLDYLQKSLSIDPNSSANQGNLNYLAYQLAGLKKYDEGLKLLEAAIKLNPQVANLYDSTAELYLMKGDTTNSVKWYKKALKIDPELQSALDALKKLE